MSERVLSATFLFACCHNDHKLQENSKNAVYALSIVIPFSYLVSPNLPKSKHFKSRWGPARSHSDCTYVVDFCGCK